ncbi:MAG: hypothetical protein ABI660_05480 [Polaromonas sp.]
MQLKGLNTTTLIMCVLNLAGFVVVDWDSPEVGILAAFYGSIIAATFIVLWYYWKRKNWARILVLIGAGLAVINMYFIAEMTLLEQAVTVSEFVFGVFMLWWLNTKVVRAYFKTSQI